MPRPCAAEAASGNRQKRDQRQRWQTPARSTRRTLECSFIGLCSQQPPPQGEPIESEVKGRQTSHVQSQPACERLRAGCEEPGEYVVETGMPSSVSISAPSTADAMPGGGARPGKPTEISRPEASPPTTTAWLKERPRPSPVIASTVPEASPINATLSRQTRFSLRFADTDPLSAETVSAPRSRALSSGNARKDSSRRKLGIVRGHSHADLLVVHGRGIGLNTAFPNIFPGGRSRARTR